MTSCGMEISPSRAIEFEYKGEKFYFCNPNCEAQFKLNPKKFKDYKGMDPKLMYKKMEEKIENKKEEDKQMGNLNCENCGTTIDLPMHCGQPMHKEGDQLVCWMGESCGAQKIPEHHDKPMEVIE